MLTNLLIAIRCIGPLLICLLVGVLVRRSGILSDEVIRQLNRFVFTFLFPQHLFLTVYNADFSETFSLPMILFQVGIVSLYCFGSVILLSRMKLEKRLIAMLNQNAYRSNLNIISLPLSEALLGPSGLASMGIISAVLTPLYNLYAVIVLESHTDGGKKSKGELILEIIKNPMIIGAAAGFAAHLLPFKLPGTVTSAISSMGKTGTTLALILLGASLRIGSLRKNRKLLIIGNVWRLIAAPLLGLLLAVALGFAGSELAIIVLALGAPTASVSFTMCQVYDCEPELAAEMVATTSMLCCLSLFLWIFLLKQLGIV